MSIRVVEAGDTLGSIAEASGITTRQLAFDNQIEPPYQLAVGQALYIAQEQAADAREVLVNGYAYPFIDPEVLGQTLPFLTELSVFSYGFTGDGDLIEPQVSDQWMLAQANVYGVRPILTLTPLSPEGTFNNYLIHQIVTDRQAQTRLIRNLSALMMEKGFDGINIDFEFILAEDRDAFTEFTRRVTDAMHALGFTVSVALAPKTARNQQGELYEGKDYPALGTIADSVLLMTYEWGYTYGPPMAVAPLNLVRNVVEYAVTEIEPAKIDLGIPNYGYDWPLPYEQGVTAAETVGNIEAVQIAVRFGAEIQFDETAQSPFFFYQNQGVQHEVWFEDVRSIQGKFNLIKEFGLRGMGYWQLMRWFRPNWLLLSQQFKIAK